MNHSTSMVVILMICSMQILHGQTIIPGGYVSGSWSSSGSPYYIQDNILIHPDSTLTIGAGTNVLFSSKKMLEIQGQLIVNGTPGDLVYFDGDQDTTTWYGLYFNTTDTSITDSSILENGDIRHCEGHPCITIKQSSRVRINGFSVCYGDSFRGGGISCISSNPYFEDLLLAYNFALDGAGISLDNSSPVMKNCNIYQNTAYGAGGGMVIFSGSSPVIDHCEFQNNSSFGSGGGVYINGSEPVFINCNFSENSGAAGGGSNYSGGAVSVKLGSFTRFENCIFNDNASNGGGGGIASFSPNQVINCLFEGNHSAISGGALYLSAGNPLESMIINNTFSDNLSPEGSTLYAHNHVAMMKNCIAWNSDTSDTSSLFLLDAIMALDALDVSYSNLQNGQAGIELTGNAGYNWGPGNIVLDPIFLPGTHDLDWQSPCIEAGTPDTTGLGLPESDLAGNPRMANQTVDIGVFEYQLPLEIPNSKFQIPGDFSVFPNPAREWIKINCIVPAGHIDFRIIDFRGDLVGKGILNASGQTIIKVSDLMAGIYFIRFDGDDFYISEKVVILD